MWGSQNCVRLSPSLNMEFMYDIDMLEIIRWPFTEGFAWTSEAFLQFMTYCQGLGHYRGPGPPGVLGSFQNFFPELALSGRSSRSDCEESDEVLMVTSNDALRFEEDCLFEPPVTRNNTADVGDVTSNRFLCQKTSMADMTLAELNDTTSAHDARFRVGLAVDQNSNSLGEVHLATGSQQVKSTSEKESACRQPVSSKLNNGGGSSADKLMFACKTERDQDKIAHGLESNVKIEPGFDSECSSQTYKDTKRRRASSITISRLGIKGDHIDAGESHVSKSSVLPAESYSLKKKLKLELSEDDSEQEHARSHSKVSSLSRAAFCKSEDTNSCDDQSDSESLASRDGSVHDLLRSTGTAEKRYFWQYNVQAKGPKEKRLCRNVGYSDPHVLKDFEDPVFDSTQREVHFVHGGKARKGDGTDITPNPRKLLNIGNELKSLNRTIAKMIQSADAATRVNTMKEKNKYASRVCRLKKKAQHEANKIKLQGLNDEHNQLMHVLNSIKSKLKENKKSFVSARKKISFANELETLVNSNLKMNVAGHADDYVSSVLLSSRSSSADDPNDAWLYSD